MPLIRDPKLSDAPVLADIHIRCWQDTYRGVVSDAYLDGLDLQQRTIRWQQILTPPGNPLAVMEVDGETVGFFSWGPTRVEELPYQYELYSLYFLKEYRGQGLGKMAIAHAKQQVNDDLLVGVLEHNPYRVFYDKLGTNTQHEVTVQIGGDAFQEVFYVI